MGRIFDRLEAKCLAIYGEEPTAQIRKAYLFAKEAHGDQKRASGEPYIVHPLSVAHILTDMEMDTETIVGSLLHDVIEDTAVTPADVKREFGEQIYWLVDGVTKLGQIPYSTKEEQQAENLRKMFLAMAKDIRVILIKLADRLHNMRTLGNLPEEKQREKATETMQIYAPLAHRLGISQIKWELEDLALRYLDPTAYHEIERSVAQKRREREKYIDLLIEELSERLKDEGIGCTIEGRAKHFYSIYKKMYAQGKGIEEIYDLFATRVIVKTIPDCYAVLGIVHEMYTPIPGRFKDYIAMPKSNMYQSLHTTVVGHAGRPFEIQIRTEEMHHTCEYGIAAHWKYKEGKTEASELDSKLTWIRQLLEIQKDFTDNEEFIQQLKINMFADEVFTFTPKGMVVNLPLGSTPIDFAYAIHSAVGNKMMGAKVSGRIVPLDYQLKTGDIVEILTSSSVHGPSLDWLKICKTSQARNKINAWFKKENREDNIARGKELMEREIKRSGFASHQLLKPEFLEPIYKKYTLKELDDLYAAVGYGGVLVSKVMTRLKESYLKTRQEAREPEKMPEAGEAQQRQLRPHTNSGSIVVRGIDNCLVRLSRCCNPVPGDEIIGFITRGRGVSVHRADCTHIPERDSEEGARLIEVSWQGDTGGTYLVNIQVTAYDRTGLLLEVSNQIAEEKVAVKSMNARILKDNTALLVFTVEINGTEQMSRIMKKIAKVNGVLEVTRAK